LSFGITLEKWRNELNGRIGMFTIENNRIYITKRYMDNFAPLLYSKTDFLQLDAFLVGAFVFNLRQGWKDG
jgi:hypothetical protein